MYIIHALLLKYKGCNLSHLPYVLGWPSLLRDRLACRLRYTVCPRIQASYYLCLTDKGVDPTWFGLVNFISEIIVPLSSFSITTGPKLATIQNPGTILTDQSQIRASIWWWRSQVPLGAELCAADCSSKDSRAAMLFNSLNCEPQPKSCEAIRQQLLIKMSRISMQTRRHHSHPYLHREFSLTMPPVGTHADPRCHRVSLKPGNVRIYWWRLRNNPRLTSIANMFVWRWNGYRIRFYWHSESRRP